MKYFFLVIILLTVACKNEKPGKTGSDEEHEGYTHAKEMRLKGRPKKMTESRCELHRQNDGELTCLDSPVIKNIYVFHKTGNIDTHYAINDAMLIHTYTNGINTGGSLVLDKRYDFVTEKTGEIYERRTWSNDKKYTIERFHLKNDPDTTGPAHLTATYWLNKDYTLYKSQKETKGLVTSTQEIYKLVNDTLIIERTADGAHFSLRYFTLEKDKYGNPVKIHFSRGDGTEDEKLIFREYEYFD